jgi:hypothetical protein
MPKQTIEDLNQKYSEADTAGQELFSEQRSNILLVSGDHYQRKSSRFWRRIRDSKDLSEQQKIRLTKNHTQKISKAYISNILGHAPGVTIVPKNDTDLSDQKSAEIQRSIWVDAKDRYKLHRRIRDWCSDFVNIGEVAVKLSYDPNAGEFLGYEQELDEFGMPMVDEWGRPAADKTKPKFSGGFVFERVFGFNLLLPAEAKDFLEAKYL